MTDKPKRCGISKKTRFEVFKRDSFTCQYCGRKSPAIVLHVDHIKPVSMGGKNNILNYVTSCVECNLGKGAVPLSDSSVVEKSRIQAEVLQQRREQLKMMLEWQLALVDEENSATEAVNDLFEKLTNGEYSISDYYKCSTISPLVKKYGALEVMEALRSGTASYGDPSKALNKIGGICHCRNNKDVNDRTFILNIMARKFYNLKRWEASDILKQGYAIGGEKFYDLVKKEINMVSGTWFQVKHDFITLLEGFKE